MHKRTISPVILALLGVVLIGLPTALAQFRGLADPDPFWEVEPIHIGTPDHDDDDDEGNDECGDDQPYCAPTAKTGQAECWRQGGAPTDCTGTGQDGELQLGVSTSPRFTNHGDGTVTDNLTGLIWMRMAACQNLSYRRWNDALEATSNLASGACSLTDGSVPGDWRMPNLKELLSVLDYGNNPAVPSDHPFHGVTENDNVWTSTTNVRITNQAWVVNLGPGYAITQFKGALNNAWAVRGPE